MKVSTAYNLPVPVINPETPSWLISVIQTMQANNDNVYKQKLDAFYGEAQKWIDSNVAARMNSADPTHYVPTAFTVPVPTREVLDGRKDGTFFSNPVLDPNVIPPVLPPYVAPAPPVQPSTDSASVAASTNNALATIITLLLQIKAKLGA